jgi:hypothetical protein
MQAKSIHRILTQLTHRHVNASEPMRADAGRTGAFARAHSKCEANAFSMPDNFKEKSSVHIKYSAIGVPLDYWNFKAENCRWLAG